MKSKNEMTDIERKIGRFMVAAGAIIEDETTHKILLVRRADSHQFNQWEVIYGRIDQHEDIDDGLRREVFEESGLTDIQIKKLIRIWHIYRGEKSPNTEVHGLTFHCIVKNPHVMLSDEHSEYKWVTPDEARSMITHPGIKCDVESFIQKSDHVILGGINTVNKQFV